MTLLADAGAAFAVAPDPPGTEAPSKHGSGEGFAKAFSATCGAPRPDACRSADPYPDGGSKPGVVSGAYVLRGTRVQTDAIIATSEDGYTPEQIAEDIFDHLAVDGVRRMIEFARADGFHPA